MARYFRLLAFASIFIGGYALGALTWQPGTWASSVWSKAAVLLACLAILNALLATVKLRALIAPCILAVIAAGALNDVPVRPPREELAIWAALVVIYVGGLVLANVPPRGNGWRAVLLTRRRVIGREAVGTERVSVVIASTFLDFTQARIDPGTQLNLDVYIFISYLRLSLPGEWNLILSESPNSIKVSEVGVPRSEADSPFVDIKVHGAVGTIDIVRS